MTNIEEIRIESMVEAESLVGPTQTLETYFNLRLIPMDSAPGKWELHFELDVPGITVVSKGVQASMLSYSEGRDAFHKEIGLKLREGWRPGEAQPEIKELKHRKTVAQLCLDVADLSAAGPTRDWKGFPHTLTLSCQELGQLAQSNPGARM